VPMFHSLLGMDHRSTLDAEWMLGWAHESAGHTNEAAKLYAGFSPRWVRLAPWGRNQCAELAAWFLNLGRLEEARAAFEALLTSFDGKPPDQPRDLGMLLVATGATKGWPAAAEVCRENFNRFPDSMWVWLHKAWVFRYVGDEEQYCLVV